MLSLFLACDTPPTHTVSYHSDGIIAKSWLQKKHNSLVDSRRRLADLTMSQRLGIEKKMYGGWWWVVVEEEDDSPLPRKRASILHDDARPGTRRSPPQTINLD
jgi:hypothetical protein